jgi:hypothetical protein
VEKKGTGQRQMEGYAGGGQGSKRAVAPLMMTEEDWLFLSTVATDKLL